MTRFRLNYREAAPTEWNTMMVEAGAAVKAHADSRGAGGSACVISGRPFLFPWFSSSHPNPSSAAPPCGWQLPLGGTSLASIASTTSALDQTTRVYLRLRELIVRGRLAPGSRIIETELASRLHVSRTPVRAALQRLNQEGYVLTLEGGRQTRLSVSPLTEEDAREIFGIVGEIEGLAARLLSAKEAEIREEVCAQLEALDAGLLTAAAAQPPEVEGIFRLFTDFHRRYVEAGAGARLLHLHDAIKPQADRYRRLYSSTQVARIRASVTEHRAIIASLRDGKPDQAHAAVRRNWSNAADRLAGVIQRSGELGSW